MDGVKHKISRFGEVSPSSLQTDVPNYAEDTLKEVLGWYGLQEGADGSFAAGKRAQSRSPQPVESNGVNSSPPVARSSQETANSSEGQTMCLEGGEAVTDTEEDLDTAQSNGGGCGHLTRNCLIKSTSSRKSKTGRPLRMFHGHRKLIGMRFLFPPLGDDLTLLEKASVWVARHDHKYFVGWTEEQLEKVDPILRPLGVITPEAYKLHMNRSEYCRNVKLKYCLEADTPWAKEFIEKLAKPFSQGGFSGLCQAKLAAAELWRKYSEHYKSHQARYPNPKSRYKPGYWLPQCNLPPPYKRHPLSADDAAEESECKKLRNSPLDDQGTVIESAGKEGPDNRLERTISPPVLDFKETVPNGKDSQKDDCLGSSGSFESNVTQKDNQKTPVLFSPARGNAMTNTTSSENNDNIEHQMCNLPLSSAPMNFGMDPPISFSPSPINDLQGMHFANCSLKYSTSHQKSCEYRRSERGLSFLFPSLSDHNLSLLDKVKVTVLRHKNNYFLGWSEEELKKIHSIIRPKVVVTLELYKEYCHRNAMKYDSNLQFALESLEDWALEFRARLSKPPSEGGFSSLCEVKLEAGRLWRQYSGKYRMHNIVKWQMDMNSLSGCTGRAPEPADSIPTESSRDGAMSSTTPTAALRSRSVIQTSSSSPPSAAQDSDVISRSTSSAVAPTLVPIKAEVTDVNWGPFVPNAAYMLSGIIPRQYYPMYPVASPHPPGNSFPCYSSVPNKSPLDLCSDVISKQSHRRRSHTKATPSQGSPDTKDTNSGGLQIDSLFKPLPRYLPVCEQLRIWLERHRNRYYLEFSQEDLANVPEPIRPQVPVTDEIFKRYVPESMVDVLEKIDKIIGCCEPEAKAFNERLSKPLTDGGYATFEDVLTEAVGLWDSLISNDKVCSETLSAQKVTDYADHVSTVRKEIATDTFSSVAANFDFTESDALSKKMTTQDNRAVVLQKDEANEKHVTTGSVNSSNELAGLDSELNPREKDHKSTEVCNDSDKNIQLVDSDNGIQTESKQCCSPDSKSDQTEQETLVDPDVNSNSELIINERVRDLSWTCSKRYDQRSCQTNSSGDAFNSPSTGNRVMDAAIVKQSPDKGELFIHRNEDKLVNNVEEGSELNIENKQNSAHIDAKYGSLASEFAACNQVPAGLMTGPMHNYADINNVDTPIRAGLDANALQHPEHFNPESSASFYRRNNSQCVALRFDDTDPSPSVQLREEVRDASCMTGFCSRVLQGNDVCDNGGQQSVQIEAKDLKVTLNSVDVQAKECDSETKDLVFTDSVDAQSNCSDNTDALSLREVTQSNGLHFNMKEDSRVSGFSDRSESHSVLQDETKASNMVSSPGTDDQPLGNEHDADEDLRRFSDALWESRQKLQELCDEDVSRSWQGRLLPCLPVLQARLGANYSMPSTSAACLVDLVLATLQQEVDVRFK